MYTYMTTLKNSFRIPEKLKINKEVLRYSFSAPEFPVIEKLVWY